MRKLTMDFSKAGRLTHAFMIPVSVFVLLSYYLLWNAQTNWHSEISQLKESLPWGLLLMLVLILLHELLHALTYLILTKDYKSISFGIHWNSLSPYCHYSRTVRVWQYRVALLVPGLLTGLLPLIIALFSGNFPLVVLFLLMTLGATGDALILWMPRNEKSQTLVKDDPKNVGCIVLEENELSNE